MHTPLHTSAILALFSVLLFTGIPCATSKLLQVGQYNITNGGMASFETAMLNDICSSLQAPYKDGCNITLLPNLDARISGLTNGTYDMTLGAFSVDLDRAEQVSFVTPFYYSVGEVVYSNDANAAALNTSAGWNGLSGQNVCALTGAYFIEDLTNKYQIVFVQLDTVEAISTAVNNGTCVAAVNDIGAPPPGLQQISGFSEQMARPYALAVPLGDMELEKLISDAETLLMNDGLKSPILAYEQEYLIPNGYPENAYLALQVLQATANKAGPKSRP